MRYGIIDNEICKDLFEKINGKSICDKCRENRKEFIERDKKDDHFSNMLLGFSSKEIKIPVDILIVGQDHGGREDLFRDQLGIDEEIDSFAKYYLRDSLVSFHQKEMRELFQYLDSKKKTWVFTDLIKCYVKNFPHNKQLAIDNCKTYLDNQIKVLRPRKILALGQLVARTYFKIKKRINHKEIINYNGSELIRSIFPSARTVDLWIRKGGWDSIIKNL